MSETETTTEPVKKNKGGRPRKAVTTASGPTFTEEQFSQLIAALAGSKSEGGGGVNADALKAILESTSKQTAVAMQKAMKPENDAHPGKSSFSYPEGDVARPRPALKCDIWWNNFPIHKAIETHHWRELELLNELEPGEYQTLRKDGSVSPDKVQVKGTADASGKLTRLDVTFPINREERHYIAPLAVMLYQMVHAGVPLKQSYMQGWQEWMSIVMEMEPAAG